MKPDAPADEIPLSGGNMTPVVRVGNTVRRAQGPWSETIHALLRHLEHTGFEGAPRFLGLDAQNREVLSFIAGDTGFVPYRFDDAVLTAAAGLLRGFHDATRDFQSSPQAQWQRSHPDPRQHEVICHNDFAPYNLIFAGSMPKALIDFDLAGPGPRLTDVAYGAYWFAPLQFGPGEEGERAAADLAHGCPRLKRFCNAYGIAASPDLVYRVEHVLERMRDVIVEGVAANDPVFIKLKDTGHLRGWADAVNAFGAHKAALLETLAG